MKSVSRGSLLSVLAVLAIGLAGVAGFTGVLGQASIPDGAFVRAGDGSVWVVSNGVRYRVAALNDDADIIGALPQGRDVATAGELAAALASGGGAAPAVASAPGPRNPAETLIGTRTTTCKGTGRFDVEVVRTDWQRELRGKRAEGNAMWVVAIITVTNTGGEAFDVAGALKLVDERGREFGQRNLGGADDFEIGPDYNVDGPFTNIQPGVTHEMLALFQTGPDVQQLKIEGSPISCI